MKISENGNLITVRAPDNWHAHFRQDAFLEFLVILFIAYGWRRRIVAEPNTTPPILTGEQAVAYGEKITKVARSDPRGQRFEVVVAIQITEFTTPETIRDAFRRGIRVCKVYPRWVTTNSENGVEDYMKIYPALAVAEELGMIVQFHPEHPSFDIMGRIKEAAFRSILDPIVRAFPRLKISVEHVSTRDMVEWVRDQSDNVGAGITIQHLMITEDDLKGYSRRSGGFGCVDDALFKPCAKDPSDIAALTDIAFSGHPRFWYAGDDAWHFKSRKHTGRCACGAGNTMATLSLLISLFEINEKIERLEPFLSEFGARFYGFPLSEETMTFRREKWRIEKELAIPGMRDESVIPFFANEEMGWRIVA